MLKVREIKALARENLLGRYGTVILAAFASTVLTMLCFLAAAAALCAALAAGGVIGNGAGMNFAGVVIGAVVFTLFLFLGIVLAVILSIGNQRLLINICRGRRYGVGDIFYGFKPGAHPLRVIAVQLVCSFVLFLFSSGIRAVSGLGGFLTRGGRTMSVPVLIVLLILIVLLGLLELYFSAAFMLAGLVVIDEPGTGVFGSIRASMDLMKKKKLKAIWMLVFSFLFWKLLGAICMPTLLWIGPYINCSRVIFYLAAREQLWQLPGSGLEPHAPYTVPAEPTELTEPAETTELTETAESTEPQSGEAESAPDLYEGSAANGTAPMAVYEAGGMPVETEASETYEETEMPEPEAERFSGDPDETGLTGL